MIFIRFTQLVDFTFSVLDKYSILVNQVRVVSKKAQKLSLGMKQYGHYDKF